MKINFFSLKSKVLVCLLMGLALAACAAPPPRAPQPAVAPSTQTSASPQTLTVMAHDSFSISEVVLKAI